MNPNLFHRYRHLAWLVVAFVVVWASLFGLSTVYPLDVYAGESFHVGAFLLVNMIGLGMGFLQWVCLWLVFGPGRYPYRILGSVLACLAGMGGVLVPMIADSWNDPNGHRFLMELVTAVLLLFPFFFLLLQLPSAIVRFLLGWRIQWGDRPAAGRPLAISDLLTITALVAGAAASRSWVNFDMRDGINLDAAIGIGVFWLPAWILFALPILYFTLTPWSGKAAKPGWKGTGLAMYVALLTLGGFIFTMTAGNGESFYIIFLGLVLAMSLLIPLGFSRRAGFRLWTRWSKRAFERAQPADQDRGELPIGTVDPLERDPPGG